jgi:hypothetical protein
MTLRRRKKVANVLRRLVKAEAPNASWSRVWLTSGLRQLVAQADRMKLTPEDVLTPTGRDAFIAIARAIVFNKTALPTVGAEWQLVLALATPDFSIEERELFAS